MDKKMFAETMLINKEPKQIGDYTYELVEKYIVDVRNSWDDFLLDKLYEFYQKEGFTRVLMISQEDYKIFLNWAIPKYKEVLEKNESNDK